MLGLCSSNDVACQTSCDAFVDILLDDNCCIHASCTSCIDLKNEVEALKVLRDDMSASLEKEDELLRTTYARCLEEQMDDLRRAPCGSCDRLKFENEVLAARCKTLSAKSISGSLHVHSEVGISKVSSLPPLMDSHVESESLGKSTCGVAKDSSPIASPKHSASLSGAQGNSSGKGVSSIFGAQVPLPRYK